MVISLVLIWKLNISSPTSLAVDAGMSATERASEGNYLLLIKSPKFLANSLSLSEKGSRELRALIQIVNNP